MNLDILDVLMQLLLYVSNAYYKIIMEKTQGVALFELEWKPKLQRSPNQQ